MSRAERSRGSRRDAPVARSADAAVAPKKKVNPSAAWRDFRELLWVHRRRLMLGLVLMLVSRLAGLVLPISSKFVVDEVLTKKNYDL